MAASPGLVINDLRGGMNDTDPPSALPDDQVVLAENVEFFDAPLGERRGGTEVVDFTGSDLDLQAGIVHIGIHYPTGADAKDCELMVVGVSENVSSGMARRDKDKVWTPIYPIDYPVATADIRLTHSQSIHGKWFVMYKSLVDRAHVWDGTRLRRVGLSIPAGTPTVATSGVGGAFTGERTYRIRFQEKDGAKILRQSEPSSEVTFTPPGSDNGAVITRAVALPGEGETHWVVEASSGDGNFYQIATVATSTPTYTDTTQPATDYALNGDLSEDIGEYDVVPSYKFVKADRDRLIFANQWEDAEKGSRVAWTPVWKDTGHGNDERIPANTDNYIDLDWMDGGSITDISDPLNGSFYVFKWQRLYKLQRTGRADSAYEAFLLSAAHGAIEGSVISGIDEYGKGCVYFLDPATGPMRVGAAGIQYLENVRGTWKRVNTRAVMVAHGVYYPDKKQVHWWIATDSAEVPNLKLVLQVSSVQSGAGKASRGWSIANGGIATALCSAIVPELIHNEDIGGDYLAFLPYAGYQGPCSIQRCDIGTTDNGVAFRARIVTKPYIVAGLLNRWGAMNAALLARPLTDDTMQIDVRFIRDFGLEDNYVTTDFVPTENETSVIKRFDNLAMSTATTIQVEFADPQ